MKGPLVLAVVALIAAGGWALFQVRSEAPDPIRARDRLVQGGIVATFEAPGFGESYRFTWLDEDRWVWERVLEGETTATTVSNAAGRFVAAAPGCYVRVESSSPPLVPGLTVARELLRLPGVQESGDTEVSYTIAAEDARGFGAGPPTGEVRVEEELAAIADGHYSARTAGDTFAIWYGEYEVRAATEAEVAAAETLVDAAAAGESGQIVVRERVLGSAVGSTVHGPYSIVVPSDCPESPLQLWPSSTGGQRPGPRVSAPSFELSIQDGFVAEEVVAVPLRIDAVREELLARAAAGNRGAERLRSGMVFVAEVGASGLLAIEVVSCLEASGQPCR